MTPPTTAIIVTYNSAAEIGSGLRALAASHESGRLVCVVVDNASTDDTLEVVRAFPWVEVVASPENLGYGRGLNLGVLHARTPNVLFMNPDAVIAEESLDHLSAFLDAHPRAGMVGPAIARGDGSMQCAGLLPTPWLYIARAAGLGRWAGHQRVIDAGGVPFKTDWLCGAMLLARTAVVKELGGFDPRFFLYFEETDLCRRMIDGGYELWAVGAALAHHVGGSSTQRVGRRLFAGCIAEHYFQSRFYYLRKHYGWIPAALTEVLEAAALAIRAVTSRLSQRVVDHGFSARMAAPFMSMPSRVVRGVPPGN